MAKKMAAKKKAPAKKKAAKSAALKLDKATVVKYIDDAIFFLEGLAPMTPWQADDTALRFIKFARNDPAFQRIIDRIGAAKAVDPSAPKVAKLENDPELQALFNRWSKRAEESGEPSGSFGELISLVFQIIAWVKAFKAKRGG